MMFDKILVANRGEIACRVIKTARELGVRTVAVFSDADARSKHVEMADQAVYIGASPVAQSYLRGDAIINAALETGAQAIHPGYGFLSENPEFVAAVEDAGLVFIGPSAKAIAAMGLKDAAKAAMMQAGVPVVPGYHGTNQNADFLAAEAEKIGYPVLIKARAGGGGKGMRLVENPAQFKDELAAAQREGQASFGDPTCLIEKYITRPRHIEVQIFGDSHGNIVHMFERDCSLQRRYQKVIEEAPAPDMPAAVRNAMGRAAVAAAKAVNYTGAGTVEFIADGANGLREDGFWFMEMNTRLQVEHPVSEAITGLDFVALQLDIAAGAPLPFSQNDLKINGCAVEARIYAEDVAAGFLPAIGKLSHLVFPQGTEFENGPVRIDSGVRSGDEITPFYDPMIAKLIVHGKNRAGALEELRDALSELQIVGAETNKAFLSALASHDGFNAGKMDTHLIERDLEELTICPEPGALVMDVACLAAKGLLPSSPTTDAWAAFKHWRHWSPASYLSAVQFAGTRIERRISTTQNGLYTIEGDEVVALRATHVARHSYRIERSGHFAELDIVVTSEAVSIFLGGHSFTFDLIDPAFEDNEASGGGDTLFAPMPGMVLALSVAVGQSVKEGEALATLEAMKMEHVLRAPRSGVIAEVLVQEGAQVTSGAVLLKLEPLDV